MIESLSLPGVLLISPKIHRDHRGFFSETYNADALRKLGFSENFVQDNHSFSVEKGVVRGLHFQTNPRAQGKLVRVVRGAILDVAVDIRHGSPTFGQHIAVTLSQENWQQLWVPVGFAHGFCTLEPNTEVVYKVTNAYAADHDKGLAWDDPEIGISWPLPPADAILSDKDRKQPKLAELPAYFRFGN